MQMYKNATEEKGLNRTFMELKLFDSPYLTAPICLNRTFMELKYTRRPTHARHPAPVLIVPLWN